MPLKISRILHAGYVFECDGHTIAFDPVFENPFSRNCHAFPDVRFDRDRIRQQRFDAVFISHFHDDHCSFESLDLIDRHTPVYLYCVFGEMFDLLRELGFVDVNRLHIDEPVRIGPFDVVPREAFDADVDSIFHIRADGLNVLNVVDSWIGSDTLAQLAEVAPWDMVLWPFQTMRELAVISPSRAEPASLTIPDDWIEQLQVLKPRYVVPSSCQFLQEPWSWYNQRFFPITYRQFHDEVETALPSTKVVRFNPSVSMTLDHQSLEPSAPLAWVIPVGEQDVDYRYDETVPPTPTSEIARHFPALSIEQTSRVSEYCHAGMLDKYRAMELPEDSYFEKERVWELSVFDHTGAVEKCRYRVHGDAIELADNDAGPLAWTTQIPAAKLYAALELGESLTSMYMRINDAVFDSGIEADIAEADVVDDPLIRCLFNDAFGAYQKAQLKRLSGLP